MKSTSSSFGGTLGKSVTTARNVEAFNKTSNGIAGIAGGLGTGLKELEADLKRDMLGLKEFEVYKGKQELRKAELTARVKANQAWIANFESNDTSGAFEAQYKKLLDEIQGIYKDACEFHGKGIDMLIKEFDYHLAFKRWNDTFTAVPFKPPQ